MATMPPLALEAVCREQSCYYPGTYAGGQLASRTHQGESRRPGHSRNHTELSGLSLWWRGPRWLEGPPDFWPTEVCADQEENEERRAHASTTTPPDSGNELLMRFSWLTKLIRVTAFCLRLLRRDDRPRTSHLSAEELKDCRLR